MYRTYELTEEEKNMPFTSMWAGDCMVYTVFETEEEKAEELARLARIDKEAEEAKKAYYNTLKEEETMTREEKLYSMTMRMLVAEAEKAGVKINRKGKKEDAVNKILEAEKIQNTEKEEETMNNTTEKIDLNDETQTQYLDLEATFVNDNAAADEETPAPKKERKTRTKKTFESLLANVPVLSRVSVQTNGKKRNAVHIQTENGKRRIFGYDGAVIVVTNEKYLHGVVEITAEKKNYGWRVEPTAENMLAIQHNYLATLA